MMMSAYLSDSSMQKCKSKAISLRHLLRGAGTTLRSEDDNWNATITGTDRADTRCDRAATPREYRTTFVISGDLCLILCRHLHQIERTGTRSGCDDIQSLLGSYCDLRIRESVQHLEGKRLPRLLPRKATLHQQRSSLVAGNECFFLKYLNQLGLVSNSDQCGQL